MEVVIDGNGASSAVVTPPAVAPATVSPPSQVEGVVAGSGGNAAPPTNPAREAFQRLAKGETPDVVNRDLYGKPGTDAKPSASPTPAKDGQAAGSGTKPQPAAAADPAGATEGIDEKDLAVLKRAKFDLGTWKHIPPSNKKAIVNSLRATQSELDRQFQQGRQQAGSPPPQQPPQTPTDQDEGTLDDDGQADLDGGQQQQRGNGRQPASQQQQQPAGGQQQQQQAPAIDPGQFIAKEDLEALELIGGPQLAETFKRGIGAAVQQAQSQLLGPIGFLLDHYETQAFNGAISQLKTQPGYGQIGDAETKAIREKADLLIRAAGDPRNYGYDSAVQDAAASLFKTNVHQASQAALLNGRQASLKATPDAGRQLASQPRSLTPQERSRAIFRELQSGQSPDAARRAVDGA